MLATPTEAARLLGITRQALYKRQAAGKLATVQQDGRTFIALPDPEPDPDVRTILERIPELPGARDAQAREEAKLQAQLDRLAECRRLLNPLRSNADNATVHRTGGFDALAREVDQLTISLATQRAKVLRCRLKVAELVRDNVSPHVASARNRYDSLRASMMEAGARLQDLQSTADSARREAADLSYQLRAQL